MRLQLYGVVESLLTASVALYLRCQRCKLVVNGRDLVALAGLGLGFESGDIVAQVVERLESEPDAFELRDCLVGECLAVADGVDGMLRPSLDVRRGSDLGLQRLHGCGWLRGDVSTREPGSDPVQRVRGVVVSDDGPRLGKQRVIADPLVDSLLGHCLTDLGESVEVLGVLALVPCEGDQRSGVGRLRQFEELQRSSFGDRVRSGQFGALLCKELRLSLGVALPLACCSQVGR